ncbi:Predicted integral membrane protein [Mycobacteroides abscessus subsp. abscessus]|nr:Predicted integral membrane protein [Mycobacteroides abscessus subsp. abscessus]
MVHILTNGVYRFCEWVMRLAYLNILWGLFTALGFGLFGWMPASIAMFSITKKWVNRETDIAIFPVFWNSYKENWRKGNILGMICTMIFLLFYIDFRIISDLGQTFPIILFLGLFLYFMTTFFYLLPIFTYYELRLFEYLKYAFFIGFLRPLHTLGIFLAVFCVTLIASLHITLLLFFSVSSSAFVITWIAGKAFVSIDNRLQRLNQDRTI